MPCDAREFRSPTCPSPASSTASGAPRTSSDRLECELYFYSRVFGFELPDPPPALEIENLDALAT